MDPKRLAEILEKASREASKTQASAHVRLKEKVKIASETAKIEDEAERMMLAIDAEAKSASRASNEGIASTITYSGSFRI